MRKESSNQFSEGLISDLNPINTPNTVLTDNLNGTIITYNGNEYSLQNDMGNYKLRDCKLKPNYVPVGIKEYGDILYIVSYNPLDEHVEIGSYPAPERLFGNEGSDEQTGNQTINSLFDSTTPIKKNTKTYKYSDLIKSSSLVTFYDGDEGVLFLNPGDKYKLQIVENKIINNKNLNLYSSEYIKHFIVDENRRLYDVQWAIDKQLPADENGYRNIGWDVPGWLALKVELSNFEEFNVNVRRISVPLMQDSAFSSTIDLDFQLKIRDSSLQENGIANLKNNGFIYLSIKTEDNCLLTDEFIDEYPLHEYYSEEYAKIPLNDLNSKFGYIDWYPDAVIYHLNPNSIITKSILNKSDIITITAIPGLTSIRTNGNNSVEEQTLIYDNFKFEQNVSLNDVGSIDTLKLGNRIFKFWIDKDANNIPEHFSIEYNVEGPFTQSSIVNLYYAIWDISPGLTKEKRLSNYAPVPNFNGIGQNMVQLDLAGILELEHFYGIEFVFAEDIKDIYAPSPSLPNDITYNKDSHRFESSVTNKTELNNEDKVKRFFKPIVLSDIFNEILSKYQIFDEEITLQDIIEAKWNKYQSEKKFGEIKYTFDENVRKPYVEWKTNNEITYQNFLDTAISTYKESGESKLSEYINDVTLTDLVTTSTIPLKKYNGWKYTINPTFELNEPYPSEESSKSNYFWKYITPYKNYDEIWFLDDEKQGGSKELNLIYGDEISIDLLPTNPNAQVWYIMSKNRYCMLNDMLLKKDGDKKIFNVLLTQNIKLEPNNNGVICEYVTNQTRWHCVNDDNWVVDKDRNHGIGGLDPCKNNFMMILKLRGYKWRSKTDSEDRALIAKPDSGTVARSKSTATATSEEPDDGDNGMFITYFLVIKTPGSGSIDINLIPIGNYSSSIDKSYTEDEVIDYLILTYPDAFIISKQLESKKGYLVAPQIITQNIQDTTSHTIKVEKLINIKPFSINILTNLLDSDLFHKFSGLNKFIDSEKNQDKRIDSNEFPNIDYELNSEKYLSTINLTTVIENIRTEVNTRALSINENETYNTIYNAGGQVGIYGNKIPPKFKLAVDNSIKKLNNVSTDNTNINTALKNGQIDSTENWYYVGCGANDTGRPQNRNDYSFHSVHKRKFCIGILNPDLAI